MDNTIYVGLSRQMTLRRELDVVANNIANADTAGFKVESLMAAPSRARPPRTRRCRTPRASCSTRASPATSARAR